MDDLALPGVGGEQPDDGLGDLLMEQGCGAGVGKVYKDIRLIAGLIKRRALGPAKRRAIYDRLMRIVGKETIEVMTKMGPVPLEEPADRNAIAAASVLAKLDSLAQADEHLMDKNMRLDSGKATESIAIVREP